MGIENRSYDNLAQTIYDLHSKEGWPHFYHLTRKDRDFYRALAQVAKEEGTWPEPEGDF